MATITQLPDELLIWIFGAASAIPSSYGPYPQSRHESRAMTVAVARIANLGHHAMDAMRAHIRCNEAYATAAALPLVSRLFTGWPRYTSMRSCTLTVAGSLRAPLWPTS